MELRAGILVFSPEEICRGLGLGALSHLHFVEWDMERRELKVTVLNDNLPDALPGIRRGEPIPYISHEDLRHSVDAVIR